MKKQIPIIINFITNCTNWANGKNINVINSYNQNPNKRSPLYCFNGYVYYGVERYGEGDLELARIKSDGTGEEYLGDYLLK